MLPDKLILQGDALFWAQLVVHLRMLSLLVLIGAFVWILLSAPASRYRTVRLTLALVLIILNLVSTIVSVDVFGVPPL